MRPIPILTSLLLLTACVSSKRYNEALTSVEKLKNDSILLEKRVRALDDEKNYLAQKCASIEQAYTNRLLEKEDSLRQKEKMLRDREFSLKDMKSRKEQEQEAFVTLAKSVTGQFLEFDVNDVSSGYNCSDIFVEISDRLLFVPGTNRIDPKASKIFAKIKTILDKNSDLRLIVVAHTDSVNTTKDKTEDLLLLGGIRSSAFVRSLIRETGADELKITAASKGAWVRPGKASAGLGRSRTELVFSSNLLPCVSEKPEVR